MDWYPERLAWNCCLARSCGESEGIVPGISFPDEVTRGIEYMLSRVGNGGGTVGTCTVGVFGAREGITTLESYG